MPKSANISSYTTEEAAEMVAKGCDRTDWARVDALTQEEIEASIDVEDEGVPDFSNVFVGMPPTKQQLTVRFDPDVIAWFKAQGPGYQTRMNAVLRSYMLAKVK